MSELSPHSEVNAVYKHTQEIIHRGYLNTFALLNDFLLYQNPFETSWEYQEYFPTLGDSVKEVIELSKRSVGIFSNDPTLLQVTNQRIDHIFDDTESPVNPSDEPQILLLGKPISVIPEFMAYKHMEATLNYLRGISIDSNNVVSDPNHGSNFITISQRKITEATIDIHLYSLTWAKRMTQREQYDLLARILKNAESVINGETEQLTFENTLAALQFFYAGSILDEKSRTTND